MKTLRIYHWCRIYPLINSYFFKGPLFLRLKFSEVKPSQNSISYQHRSINLMEVWNSFCSAVIVVYWLQLLPAFYHYFLGYPILPYQCSSRTSKVIDLCRFDFLFWNKVGWDYSKVFYKKNSTFTVISKMTLNTLDHLSDFCIQNCWPIVSSQLRLSYLTSNFKRIVFW